MRTLCVCRAQPMVYGPRPSRHVPWIFVTTRRAHRGARSELPD